MPDLSKTLGLSGNLYLPATKHSQMLTCKKSSRLTIPLLLLLAICFFHLPAQAQYGGGSGTADDPYLIYDANQMNAIGANPADWDKNFKLMADIDLSAFTGTAFNIIADFTGVFDGNGFVISNFTYTSTNAGNIALFVYVSAENAEIKNLGLIAPDVDAGSRDYAGSLVSQLSGGTITNCYVLGGSVAGASSVGGLVGDNNGTITSSYATTDASGTIYVGGLVGSNGGTITNCYAEGGTVSGGNVVGGLVGYNDGWFRAGTINNCYSTGTASGGQYIGGLIGYNWEGEVINCFWDIDTSGQSTSAGGTPKTTAEMQTTDTFVAWACYPVWTIDEDADYPRLAWQNTPGDTIAGGLLGGGTGTLNDPYLIYTDEQLNTIGLLPCEWGKHFLLCADIDLSIYTGTAFNIIGTDATPFTGTFDGNSHTISNFSYTSTQGDNIGLFGCIDGPDAEIKDLGLITPDVDGGTGDYLGSLVGYVKGGTITACYAEDGSVSGNYGGDLDYTFTTIPAGLRDIRTTGTPVILGDDQVTDRIILPFSFNFYGMPLYELFISSNGFITFSRDQGSGCCSGQPLPGPSIPNALIAGFWGDLYPPGGGTIRYQALGYPGSRQFVIGFYEVSHCCGADNFPVTFEIILHEGTNNIELQYGSAPSSGGYHSIGIENFDGTDGLQLAYGYDVSFDNEAFLIVAFSGSRNVGALVGQNEGTIFNSYSTSDVLGIDGDGIGGLVGSNLRLISNCYSTGSVSGENNVGGLVGDNLGTVFSSFWDIETSGQPTGDGGTGLPTARMQMASTFITWGCDSVWTIDDGNDYPRLVWENMPGELISKSSYGGGTGTQADPYLIYTAEQLNMVGSFLCDLDKHFMLMADIDLSAYTAGAFNIIGNEMTAFTGTFDGNDHTISNFSYTSTGKSHTGLFSYVDGPDAVIKDLQLLAPNVNAGTAEYAGALVGWLGDGTITNCYVQGGSVAGGSRVGGLAGENDGIINNSYASSTVEGNVGVGGLVGYNIGDPSVYLYTADTISSDLRNIRTTGTIVSLGDNQVSNPIPLPFNFSFYGTDVSQVYISSNGFITFLGDLNSSNNAQELLTNPGFEEGTNTDPWNETIPPTGWQAYGNWGWAGWKNNRPAHTGTKFVDAGAMNYGQYGVWYQDIDVDKGKAYICSIWAMTEGWGSNPHASMMMEFRDASNRVLSTDRLDIFTGTRPSPNVWTQYVLSTQPAPAGTTYARFLLRGEAQCTAMFDDASVVPVGLEQNPSRRALPDPSYPNGLIAGFWNDLYPPGGGTIRYQTLGTEGSRDFVVGFYAVPHCCTVNFYPVTFEIILHEGTNNIELQYGSAPSQGGIHSAGIENFDGTDGLQLAYGDVSFNNEGLLITFGGLVEKTRGIISNCYSTGDVSGTTIVGGLVGFNKSGIVTDCQSDSRVLGTTQVGGLVGYNTWGTITDSHATGEVTGSEMMIGGLTGLNEWGIITDCYATGDITDSEMIVGGLIGYNATGTITGSYATGSVSGFIYVGGLAGASGGKISFCYSQGGNASGDQLVGGLVGYNVMGTVTNSYATTSASGIMYVGGLAGANGGTMSNCYAKGGSASGDQFVGGLVGFNMEIISNSYSNYSVSGNLYVGGLVGLNGGPVIASFWDIETSGQTTSTAGTGRTTTEMQTESTFTNAAWDFTTPVWTIEEGNDYPRLWWEIVPVLHPEPEITLGTSNTIYWDPIPGANDYYAECAADANFTTIIHNTGWITETSCTFTGLESRKRYWYCVKARNSAAVETNWSNVESSLQVTLDDAVDMLLDPRSLKNRNMKNALLNKINAVLQMLDEGLYAEALDKLQYDILAKMNGCVLIGGPDRNDWIKTCEAQALIYPLVMETIDYVRGLLGQSLDSPEWLRTSTGSTGNPRRSSIRR